MRASDLILPIAAILIIAPAAHAQTYRWVDERGVVMQSDELPEPSAAVQELAVVEGTGTLSALEQRTLEIINEERRRVGAEATAAGHAPGYPASAEAGAVAGPYPHAPRRGATEAVRDPCLVSPDPRCYEKNAHNYDAYLGYAPSVLRGMAQSDAAAPSAAGATSAAGAGGSVSGVAVPSAAATSTARSTPRPAPRTP